MLVPTRELCKQVYEVITAASKFQKITTVEVYGGVPISSASEIKFGNGAQIVIATPGRLIDLYNRS